MEEKKLLRRYMGRRLRDISPEQRLREESRVYASLTADPLWTRCKAVCGYLPMDEEFNIEPILRAALAQEKIVALPRVEGANMEFYLVTDLEGPWNHHSYGMREPMRGAPRADLDELCGAGLLILVPGLAFIPGGYRLGHGGGYYDRLLSGLAPRAETAACLYAEQMVKDLPLEPHDEPVSRLFTG